MGAQIDWKSLEERAWAARERAYAPYSKFAVGAALLADSGVIFTGCNVENVSFGLTICAERVAVSAAISAGCRQFSGIAVVADTEVPVIPCGACRQFLAEFSPSLAVYCVGRDGVHRSWLLSVLLPAPFDRIANG
jgi:cytidine deaminase